MKVSHRESSRSAASGPDCWISFASRVWNVTALCFLVALGLVWAGLSPSGTQIQIKFADGSGLTPGDKVRCRGIDVGQVMSVVLDEDLRHVTVTAELNARVACAGAGGHSFLD